MSNTGEFQASIKFVGDFSKINQELNKLKSGKTINLNNTANGINSVGNAAKNSTGLLNNFVSSLGNLGEIIPKVMAFSLATSAIGLFTDGIREAITTVFDFDEALTEFKKVSDLSGESLDSYINQLGELGETVAKTTTEMIEGATEFRKAGYSESEAAQLSQMGALFQNIADSQISAGEASGFIVSQMKAFNIDASESITILDALNAISNNMAVSSTDLSQGLSKSSAALATYGNDINESMALLTAGAEILHGQAGRVALGLRTVGANIANIANQAGTLTYTVNGMQRTISLLDETTGDMKNTFQVFKDIYTNGWNEMSNAEKEALGIQIGNKNRLTETLAVLNNFEGAQKAMTLAEESSGSAMRENEAVLESLNGHLAKLKQQFSELVLGNGGLNDFLKKIIDLGTAILKFANSDIGQFIIKTTLLTGGLSLLGKGIGGITKRLNPLIQRMKYAQSFGLNTISSLSYGLQGFSKTFAKLHSEFIIAKAGATGFTATAGAGFKALLSVINPVTLGLTAISGVLVLLYMRSQKVKEAFSNDVSALNELDNKIAEVQQQYDALNGKSIDELTQKEKALTAEYKQQLDYLKAQKYIKEEETYNDFQNKYGNTLSGTTTTTNAPRGGGLGGGIGVSGNDAYSALLAGTATQEQLDKLKDIYDEASKVSDDFWKQRANNGEEFAQQVLDFIDTYEKAVIKSADIQEDASAQEISSTQQLINSYDSQIKEIQEANPNLEILSQAYRDVASGASLTESAYSKLIKAYPTLAANTKKIGDMYYVELDAMKAVGSGAISLSKQEAKSSLAIIKAKYAEADARVKAAMAAINAQAASDPTGNYQRYLIAHNQQLQAAASERDSLGRLANQYQKLIPLLSDTTSSTNGNTSAKTKNTKATNKQTKAEEKLQKALEATKNKYEAASKYMVSKIDLAINQLNAQKQAIQDTNDKLSTQIELEEKLKALQEAKSKKLLVYKNGRYQYSGDIDAVSSAQKDYNDTILKQKQDAQISAIDKQIDKLEAYKEEWSNIVDIQEELQNRALAAQVLGIKTEGNNWETRIKQAQAYAKKYAEVLNKTKKGSAYTVTDARWADIVTNPTKTTNAASYNVTTVQQGGTSTTKISIGNITLPNVSNANQFIQAITTQFSGVAAQKSGKR